MNKEELLKPRWKVIADYPGSLFKVGQVVKEHQFKDPRLNYYFQYESYPTIFKKLEWWEERDEKDMPEYVRVTHTIPLQYYQQLNGIYKVIEWKDIGIVVTEDKSIGLDKWIKPATEEEYLNQKGYIVI